MNYRLTFVTSSTYLLKETELQQIIIKNSELSANLSLNGLFLYLNGCSLEIVEGTQENTSQYLDLIKSYEWHSRLIVLGCRPLEQNFFDAYSIAYRIPSAVKLGNLDVLLNKTDLNDSNKVLLALISNFYKNNINN